MEVITVDFEEDSTIVLENGKIVTLRAFKERDPYVVKLGIDAPRDVRINREEVQKNLELYE